MLVCCGYGGCGKAGRWAGHGPVNGPPSRTATPVIGVDVVNGLRGPCRFLDRPPAGAAGFQKKMPPHGRGIGGDGTPGGVGLGGEDFGDDRRRVASPVALERTSSHVTTRRPVPPAAGFGAVVDDDHGGWLSPPAEQVKVTEPPRLARWPANRRTFHCALLSCVHGRSTSTCGQACEACGARTVASGSDSGPGSAPLILAGAHSAAGPVGATLIETELER